MNPAPTDDSWPLIAWFPIREHILDFWIEQLYKIIPEWHYPGLEKRKRIFESQR